MTEMHKIICLLHVLVFLKQSFSPCYGIVHSPGKRVLCTLKYKFWFTITTLSASKGCHSLAALESFDKYINSGNINTHHSKLSVEFCQHTRIPTTECTQFIGSHTSCEGAPKRMLQFSNTPYNIEESFLQVYT